MHPVVNHLIQLQELTMIRDEQKVAAGGKHLQQLNASIKTMTGKLPQEERLMYEKLHKRDGIVVSSVSNGHCAICGMKLAISFVQAVRMAKEILTCPNCARILFCPPRPVRRVGEKLKRTAPRKVGIGRFSSSSLMVPQLEATEKDDAIRELATRVAEEGFVDDGPSFIEEVLRREAILSTAVEHGLAFPHVRGVEGGGLALALGVSRKGIKWGGPGRSLTRIIFLIAIPSAASAFYLKLLAGLAETFTVEENRDAVVACEEPEELWKVLTKVTRTTIK